MAYETTICLTELIERGWSEGLIDQLLGEPHETRANPRNRGWPRMKLYRRDAVEAFEQTTAFVAHQVRRRIDDSARRSAQTRSARRAAISQTASRVNNARAARQAEMLARIERIETRCAAIRRAADIISDDDGQW